MNDELTLPNEGLPTLGAQFTKRAVDKICGAVKKLIDQGWDEPRIHAKMNSELMAFDEHTRRRLYDMAVGKDIADDITAENLVSSTEVKPGTNQVEVKEEVKHLKTSTLIRFGGQDWYVGGFKNNKYVLKLIS